jgi:hypothetical protein
MQSQIEEQSAVALPLGPCHCAFAVYANVPVCDERGRYCSACGHYEFAARESGTRRQ